MGSDIEVVQSTDGTWHRLDILGCDYANVIREPKAQTNVSTTSLDELGGDLCAKCTW